MKERDSIGFEKKEDTAKEKEDPKIPDESEIEEEVDRDSEKREQEEKNEKEETEWDGSESEFVEDDDAPEYQEKYSGIKFSYVLKREEVFSCIRHCGLNKKVTVWGSVLLAFFTLVYLILYITRGDKINLFCALGGTIIFALWSTNVLPSFIERLNYEKISGNRRLSVEVYPDEITINDGVSEWDILLDGSSAFEEFNNMFLIFLPRQKIFIIPKRAIEPDVLLDVEAMILAGTTPTK